MHKLHLLDFFFPRRCVSCGKIGVYFCSKCLGKIDFIDKPICPVCARPAINGATHPRCKTPLSLDGMYALAHYKGPIRQAIHLLKYKYVSDLAGFLADLLLIKFPRTIPKLDYLSPIPLHPKREKDRGFNQAKLLADYLCQQLATPILDGVLYRKKITHPQAKLKGQARKENIRHAFEIRDNKSVSGKIIGLVDDVATTRSTLFECCKVLKRNGAKTVWGIVLAHG